MKSYAPSEKLGGGTVNFEERYVYSNSFALNSTYKYVATGYFVCAVVRRDAALQVAPYICFYVKNGDTYTPITNTQLITQGANTYCRATSIVKGDIYVRLTSGTSHTPGIFDVEYLVD